MLDIIGKLRAKLEHLKRQRDDFGQNTADASREMLDEYRNRRLAWAWDGEHQIKSNHTIYGVYNAERGGVDYPAIDFTEDSPHNGNSQQGEDKMSFTKPFIHFLEEFLMTIEDQILQILSNQQAILNTLSTITTNQATALTAIQGIPGSNNTAILNGINAIEGQQATIAAQVASIDAQLSPTPTPTPAPATPAPTPTPTTGSTSSASGTAQGATSAASTAAGPAVSASSASGSAAATTANA